MSLSGTVIVCWWVMAVVIANRRIVAGYWRMLLIMAAPMTAVGTCVLGWRDLVDIVRVQWWVLVVFLVASGTARAFADILIGGNMGELSQGDVGWRTHGTGTVRRGYPDRRIGVRVVGVLIHTLGDLRGTFSTRLKQDAALLTAVRWRRSQAACHRSETPLLHVPFDEHKSHLAEIHMDRTGPIRPDGRKVVLRLLTVNHLLQLLPVASEEDGSRTGPVTHADDIPLEQLRAIRSWCEGLVIAPVPR